jgi:hypothetical protein
MSYNTPQQFLNFSLCSGSFNNSPVANIQECLEIGQSMIDSALLSANVTLPITDVPEQILDIERTIAAWLLFQQQGLDPGARYKFLETRYREVVGAFDKPDSGMLGMLANRLRGLVGNDDQPPSPPQPISEVIGPGPRDWYTVNPNYPTKQFIS